MPSRRHVLTVLGSGVLAGCSLPGSRAPTATETSTRTPTGTATETESVTLRLVTAASGEALDGPLAVHPPDLREDLLLAAETSEPVRGHAVAAVHDAPRPVVTGFDVVELVGTDGADGTYAVTAEGGTRYELKVGLERADPPADATVTDVGDLFAERASFLRTALDGAATVYPETRRGEWVRHEVFDGYFGVDGTTYRGYEIQQTDAAFFSEEIWYVLGLSRSTATASRRLRFPELSRPVRETADELLARSDAGGATLESVPETVASQLVDLGPFLGHGLSFRFAVDG